MMHDVITEYARLKRQRWRERLEAAKVTLLLVAILVGGAAVLTAPLWIPIAAGEAAGLVLPPEQARAVGAIVFLGELGLAGGVFLWFKSDIREAIKEASE